MMVSLSIRIEDHIMADSDFGNRTGQWFWEMVVSLGLFGMDDVQFSESQARAIIDNFQSLNYAPNGQGGLFTLKKPRGDMRKYDIWYQMQFYISENYPSDDFI